MGLKWKFSFPPKKSAAVIHTESKPRQRPTNFDSRQQDQDVHIGKMFRSPARLQIALEGTHQSRCQGLSPSEVAIQGNHFFEYRSPNQDSIDSSHEPRS